MNLKKQIKIHLQLRGITASELSRQSGVPKQNISDWLAGTMPRDIRKVKKIADALNVSIDHLVFVEGTEVNEKGVIDFSKNQPNKLSDWMGGTFEVKFRKVKEKV